jgi:hypothetical protein
MNGNEIIVLQAVFEYGLITRPDLVIITGLARTTVYGVLVRLLNKHKIRQFSEKRTKRGRPKFFFEEVPVQMPPIPTTTEYLARGIKV